ncbi:MAG: prepilin-type N-terminal cleavage/methylation domain-containing protein [Deltaproteobacteria bacterium]|nr:prepilin-type N-terminal cleavage/methylation domain-containing protein [Deltaproteobacteria bacterium]
MGINSKTARPVREKGFTLVEVLIAITIFAYGILAVAGMQIASMKGNTSARDLTEASTVGSDQLEKLMLSAYDSISDGSRTKDIYGITWNVQDNTPQQDTKTVIVNVSWTERGTQRRVSMCNVIAKLE